MFRVKVADFGLSQFLREGDVGQDGKTMRGSPLWNAPEVLQREQVIILSFFRERKTHQKIDALVY